MNKLIVSLCDFTGNWVKPYRDAGYEVIQVDLKHGGDVRMLHMIKQPVHGILAAPPCTKFAVSGNGARQREKDAGTYEIGIMEALSIVDACLRFVAIKKPKFWAVENPIGTLHRWLGPPQYRFNPCDHGDPYTKKTCLWGDFNHPVRTPVEPTEGSKMWKRYGGKSERTKAARSETPMGFSTAFFQANP